MKRISFLLAGIGVVFFILSAFADTGSHPLFGVRLPVPDNEAVSSALGLSGTGDFSISDIDADAVIVEIFSMYCPHCQREAPLLNQFYETVQKEREAGRKIIIIGIGAGNSDYEVDFFREKFEIQFPLFSDIDYSLHKALGGRKTPHFFIADISGDSSGRVFYDKTGAIEDYGVLLNLIRKETGDH